MIAAWLRSVDPNSDWMAAKQLGLVQAGLDR
jgi:hypothetical protein